MSLLHKQYPPRGAGHDNFAFQQRPHQDKAGTQTQCTDQRKRTGVGVRVLIHAFNPEACCHLENLNGMSRPRIPTAECGLLAPGELIRASSSLQIPNLSTHVQVPWHGLGTA